MNVAYTNDSLSAVGFISFVGFDTSIGDSGNQVQLKLHSSQKTELAKGSLIWSPGTEYGGIIQDIQSKLETDGQRYVYYSGPSWSGRLSQRIVCPPTGKDHYTLEGEANEALNTLMEYLGLDYLFQAPEGNSGITLNTDLDRFADGYSALRKAAAENDCRLSMAYDNAAKKVIILFVKRETHGNYTSDNSPISVTVGSPVNHLVCAGTGELQNRVVVHLYIDNNGNVSQAPYYTRADEITALYENTSADKDKLIEEGTKKLLEYQEVNQVEISVEDGSEDLYQLDDVIVGFDPVTGIKASSTIAKKVVSVDAQGFESYRYEAADVGSSGSTLSTEVSGGSGLGATYTAGYGIEITNNEISADVGIEELNEVEQAAQTAAAHASNAAAEAADALSAANTAQQTADGKADAVHTHAAADTTSGVFDLARIPTIPASKLSGTLDIAGGGTGANNAADARANLGITLENIGAAAETDLANYLPLTGGTLTGSLMINGGATYKEFLVTRTVEDKIKSASLGITNDNYLTVQLYNTVSGATENSIKLSPNESILKNPLTVSSGGTGANTAEQARENLGAAPEDHTHNYAGSSSPGGAATSANKLATARTIKITGAVNGQAVFDGSEDITIVTAGDSAAAGFLAAHPVGSIYACNTPTNPGVTYGGTWQALASADSFKWLRIE